MTSKQKHSQPLPFDILQAFAFMVWLWRHYPEELVEYAKEYADYVEKFGLSGLNPNDSGVAQEHALHPNQQEGA